MLPGVTEGVDVGAHEEQQARTAHRARLARLAEEQQQAAAAAGQQAGDGWLAALGAQGGAALAVDEYGAAVAEAVAARVKHAEVSPYPCHSV